MLTIGDMRVFLVHMKILLKKDYGVSDAVFFSRLPLNVHLQEKNMLLGQHSFMFWVLFER